MQLETIDKARYNKHVKITFFAICGFMLVVALGTSAVLIHFWGGPEGDNFWLNALGVVIAALALAQILSMLRHHPFLYEVAYVRRVKGELNRIYRKQQKIKAAAEKGDPVAMTILDFSYRASRQVYELDNNTLTLEELERAQRTLNEQREAFGVASLMDYSGDLLERF